MTTATRSRKRTGTQAQEAISQPAGQSQPTASYFRTLFQRYPTWLNLSDNTQILDQYRRDHGMAPGARIDKKVVANLSNLKSQLRSQGKAAGAPPISGQQLRGPRPSSQAIPGYQAPGAMPGLPPVPTGCQLVFLPGAKMGDQCRLEQTPHGLALVCIPATGTATTA